MSQQEQQSSFDQSMVDEACNRQRKFSDRLVRRKVRHGSRWGSSDEENKQPLGWRDQASRSLARQRKFVILPLLAASEPTRGQVRKRLRLWSGAARSKNANLLAAYYGSRWRHGGYTQLRPSLSGLSCIPHL